MAPLPWVAGSRQTSGGNTWEGAQIMSKDIRAVQPGEAGLRRFLETLEAWGFAALTQTPTELESVALLAGKIGYVRGAL